MAPPKVLHYWLEKHAPKRSEDRAIAHFPCRFSYLCWNLTKPVVEIHTAEPLSPISVGDYLYEVSFPDPLAMPRGHILQVAAKQHVISTHARDQVAHITKVCVKAVPTPDGLF